MVLIRRKKYFFPFYLFTAILFFKIAAINRICSISYKLCSSIMAGGAGPENVPCCSVTLDVCNYREFFFSIDHEKKIMFNYLKFIKISEKNPVLNWK